VIVVFEASFNAPWWLSRSAQSTIQGTRACATFDWIRPRFSTLKSCYKCHIAVPFFPILHHRSVSKVHASSPFVPTPKY
jgi:hypothetical protein